MKKDKNIKQRNYFIPAIILLFLIVVIHVFIFMYIYMTNDGDLLYPGLNIIAIFVELALIPILVVSNEIHKKIKSNNKETPILVKSLLLLAVIVIIISIISYAIKYTYVYVKEVEETQEKEEMWNNRPHESVINIEDEKMYYGKNNTSYKIGQDINLKDVDETIESNDYNSIGLQIYIDSSKIKKTYICFKQLETGGICIGKNDEFSFSDAAYKLGNEVFKTTECDGNEEENIIECKNNEYKVTYKKDDTIEATNYKKTCIINKEAAFCE